MTSHSMNRFPASRPLAILLSAAALAGCATAPSPKHVADGTRATLAVIETTDLVFALDSIPAIFAVTLDPFIVYTSNVFAILGLRALYFLLAGAMGEFRYLKVGLSLVLGFVGVKMLIAAIHITIPIVASLAVIALILIVSIVASVIASKREEARKVVH